VLSAAPQAIRFVFLKSSAHLLREYGAHIGGGLEQLCGLLRELVKNASTTEMKAKFAISRLRLSNLLTTSDLPWDRLLGYKEASLALVDLNGWSDYFSEPQLAGFAALEQRLAAKAADEGFPPASFSITGGQVRWDRDPFTGARITLRDPLVVAIYGGLVVHTLPNPATK
jgi:hypothetical protein